jgi:hypothetical protein
VSGSSIKLLIPGPWKNRSAFVKAMAEHNGGAFLAAGQMIFDAGKKRHVDFDVFEQDEELAHTMWVGSGQSIADDVMLDIVDHSSVAFLSFETGDEWQDGVDEGLRDFTGAVRSAGGLAVKVLDCGMSHGWDRWDALLANPMPSGLFQALVLQVPDPDAKTLSPFGMQQFGLPDASVHDDGTNADPAWALFEFNIYLWQQTSRLADGHAFARNMPDAQKYKLRHGADERYGPGLFYSNPFGIWHMLPV